MKWKLKGANLYFKWFDLWVGVFIDRYSSTSRQVYIQLIPMVGLHLLFWGTRLVLWNNEGKK